MRVSHHDGSGPKGQKASPKVNPKISPSVFRTVLAYSADSKEALKILKGQFKLTTSVQARVYFEENKEKMGLLEKDYARYRKAIGDLYKAEKPEVAQNRFHASLNSTATAQTQILASQAGTSATLVGSTAVSLGDSQALSAIAGDASEMLSQSQMRELLEQQGLGRGKKKEETAQAPTAETKVQERRPVDPLPPSAVVVHEDKELGKGQWNRVLAGSIAGKPVAVKVSKGTTAEDKARIDSDLAVLRKLRHEFIVQLTHPVHYAMECCFGDILTHVADLSKAGLSKEDSRRLGLTFFVQLLRAVDYLHNQKNIAHCDLKPQNAMIGDDGCLRVVDFGSARSTVAVGTPTEYTPFYGAPEFDSPLLTQSGLAGCDIWSLGCVLFRVLNGIELGATMPKEAQASVNSFFAHLRGPYCDQRRQMNVPADKTSFDHLLHFMLMPPTKIKFGTGEDLSDTLMPNPARFDIRQVLNHPAIKNFKPYLPVELKQLLGRRLAAISYAESSGA